MSHDGLGSRPLSREFLTPSSTDPFPQEAYTASLEVAIAAAVFAVGNGRGQRDHGVGCHVLDLVNAITC